MTAGQTTLTFVSSIAAPEGDREAAYWFAFQGDKLLVHPRGDAADVPLAADLSQLGVAPIRQVYLGYLQDAQAQKTHCYCAEIAPDVPLPDGLIAEACGSSTASSPSRCLRWPAAEYRSYLGIARTSSAGAVARRPKHAR